MSRKIASAVRIRTRLLTPVASLALALVLLAALATTIQAAPDTPLPPAGGMPAHAHRNEGARWVDTAAAAPTQRALAAVDGAAVTVTIRNFEFTPSIITVTANTTVFWTNDGPPPHTSTSSDALWDSGVLSSGDVFSHTFGVDGTFEYFCDIHESMRGTVRVETEAPPGHFVFLPLITR